MKVSGFVSTALIVLLSACSREMPSPQEERTVISISTSDSKTQLAPAEESGRRKVVWSEGDKVEMNGCESQPVDKKYVGLNTASFTFEAVIEPPYKLVYPASISKQDDIITLPSVQKFTEDSFQSGSAPLVAAFNNLDQNVSLHATNSIVKIRLKKGSHDDAIRKVMFISGNGERVSGDFKVDFETGTLTAAETGTGRTHVSVDMASAVLSDEPLEIHIAVPAAVYSKGFIIRIVDINNHFMDAKRSSEITLSADKISAMPPVAFEPTGTLIEVENDDFNTTESTTVEITTAGDLVKFASDFNSGAYKDKDANNIYLEFKADIDFTDVTDLPVIGNETYVFSGILNGNNHKISKLASGAPLFSELRSASVQNLIFEADCTIRVSDATDFGLIAGRINETRIAGINVNCDINVNIAQKPSASFAVGAVAGVVDEGSTIEKCVMNGALTLTDSSTSTISETLGGVAGHVKDRRSVIRNCDTNGIVTFKGTSSSLNMGGIAGISVGDINSCKLTKHFVVSQRGGATSCIGGVCGALSGSMVGCHNDATDKACSVDSQADQVCVGGVIGKIYLGAAEAGIDECINNAAISQTSTTTANSYTGGIVGVANGGTGKVQIIENCTNNATITADAAFVGGISGLLNQHDFQRYCVNKGKVTATRSNAIAGGLTGQTGNNVTTDYSSNYGDVTASGSSATAGAMIGRLNNATTILTGGGNYGKIISANTEAHGLICGSFTAFSVVDGCYAGGECYTYNASGAHSKHTVTKANLYEHLGAGATAAAAKITNISSPYDGSDELNLKDAELRILFIGNSFTDDAVKHLPGIINAAGLSSKITIAHMYFGGRIMNEYNDWSKADYTLYKFEADANTRTWTTHSGTVSINQVAQCGRWDIITLQEHTGNYHGWDWNTEEKASFTEMIEKLKNAQKGNSPKFYYIYSQSYFDMNKIGSSSRPYITWPFENTREAQLQMYDVCTAFARNVIRDCDFTGVIATGTMLQNLRTSEVETGMDLTRDGYHMDLGIARTGAAYTVFESIITPKFGVKLDGNSYRHNEGTIVTDTNAPVALQAARYAIAKPFEITDMTPQKELPDLSGKGTETDPYIIANAKDLGEISKALESNTTIYFRQTADVDMSGITSWTPCCNAANKYMVYDADDHSITNMNISGASSLFGSVNGQIKNLRFTNCSITSNSAAALLCDNGGGAIKTYITNVSATGCSVRTSSTSLSDVGGLCASIGNAVIENCSYSGTINTSNKSGFGGFTGGIVGEIISATTINRCHSNVQMTGTSENCCAGGIVGGSKTNIATTVTNCYSEGRITKMSYAGGIAGDLSKGSRVECCYSTIVLNGRYCLGGVVGRMSNYVNPNSSKTFDTDINETLRKCIAWNASITTTSATSPSNSYSSGAVLGFTVYKNTLEDCRRISGMTFNMYTSDGYNTTFDQENSNKNTPYVKVEGSDTYYLPYHGKAAEAGATLSGVAASLGWDNTVWDLSGNMPVLR